MVDEEKPVLEYDAGSEEPERPSLPPGLNLEVACWTYGLPTAAFSCALLLVAMAMSGAGAAMLVVAVIVAFMVAALGCAGVFVAWRVKRAIVLDPAAALALRWGGLLTPLCSWLWLAVGRSFSGFVPPLWGDLIRVFVLAVPFVCGFVTARYAIRRYG